MCVGTMSILEILNDLTGRQDSGRKDSKVCATDLVRQKCPALLRDAILQTLAEDYAQSQSNYNKLVEEHGADSPMAELAEEMLASARAAIETRLCELGLKMGDLAGLYASAHPARSRGRQAENYPQNYPRSLSDKGALKQRRAHELGRQKEIARQKSEIAANVLWAFVIYSMLASPYQRRPFMEAGASFRRAAGQESG